MRSKKTITYYFLIIVGVLVLVNVLSNRFFLRLDFTADKQYTLSEATKDILKELEEPVTITAYFSDKLPPEIAKTKKDFEDLLIEYESYSSGMLLYEFINPGDDNKVKMEAAKAGIQPVLINVREKDQMTQKEAYLGAVIRVGEQSEAIPLIQPGTAMEYDLSSNIKKLSVNEKAGIGFIQGHGEPSLMAMQQVMQSLNILYEPAPVAISDTSNNLKAYKTIAIVAPTDTLPENHLQKLDNYLADGGNIFIAMNKVEGDFRSLMGKEVSTGLEGWLKEKGIVVENNFIIDASCGSVQVRQANFPFPISMNFPYFPIISNFNEHPVTKGLEAVIMQFASSITFSGDTSIKFTPLALTSEKTGTESVPLYFNVQKEWAQADFPLKGLTVAAVFSGKFVGNKESKIILVSDGDFAVNGQGQAAQQQQPDNINLMVNAIDWLSDDTGLIDLRTKGVTARPLDQLEDTTKTLLKYLNFLLPIIGIIIYGFLRFQRQRILRIKRMEENYV